MYKNTNLRYRANGEHLIEKFAFHNYHGGSTDAFRPSKRQTIWCAADHCCPGSCLEPSQSNAFVVATAALQILLAFLWQANSLCKRMHFAHHAAPHMCRLDDVVLNEGECPPGSATSRPVAAPASAEAEESEAARDDSAVEDERLSDSDDDEEEEEDPDEDGEEEDAVEVPAAEQQEEQNSAEDTEQQAEEESEADEAEDEQEEEEEEEQDDNNGGQGDRDEDDVTDAPAMRFLPPQEDNVTGDRGSEEDRESRAPSALDERTNENKERAEGAAVDDRMDRHSGDNDSGNTRDNNDDDDNAPVWEGIWGVYEDIYGDLYGAPPSAPSLVHLPDDDGTVAPPPPAVPAPPLRSGEPVNEDTDDRDWHPSLRETIWSEHLHDQAVVFTDELGLPPIRDYPAAAICLVAISRGKLCVVGRRRRACEAGLVCFRYLPGRGVCETPGWFSNSAVRDDIFEASTGCARADIAPL